LNSHWAKQLIYTLHPKTMSKRQNASLGFIFVTILVDVIGLGIIIPILPELIQTLTGEGLSDASRYGGWLIFTYALMQFLFAPVLGALSDRYGRRRVILFSLFGLSIDYLVHAWAPTITFLFIGRFLAGITGASITAATAYVADISAPEKRAQNFGLISAAFGLGFIIGPVLGGLLSKWGIRVPFYAAAGITMLNFIYGLFILPESLPESKRRAFDWNKVHPLGTIKNLKSYPVVGGLLVSLFLVHFAAHSLQSTWSFFTMFRFEWTAIEVGYSLGVVGVMAALVQGGLIRIIIPWIGEVKSVMIGFLLWITGMVLFSLANEGWMMYVFLIPYCLGGIAGPAIMGIISNQVPDNRQGELQGGIISLVSLTSIFGPLIMTGIFAFFTKDDGLVLFPSAPFVLGALLIGAALIFSLSTLRTLRLKKVEDE
jgi:MFS transporter, DHA1 family, tetracycline resistance protein